MPPPFEWTQASEYARNYVFTALEERAREMEKLAEGQWPERFRVAAEQRAFAFRAAMVKLAQIAQEPSE